MQIAESFFSKGSGYIRGFFVKAFLKNSMTVLTLVGVALAFNVTASAQGAGRQSTPGASGITSGYRDGYWDTAGHWCRWDSARDTRNYQESHAGTFRDWNHATATVVDGWPAGTRTSSVVAYAYRDGYWDRTHRWHRWNDDREHRNYRVLSAASYHDWNHDRDGGSGWRQD